MAATQVSVACRSNFEVMQQDAAGDAKIATRMLAESASEIVSVNRDSTFSSTTMRGKARKISDGSGTMKRLINGTPNGQGPRRMSASTKR